MSDKEACYTKGVGHGHGAPSTASPPRDAEEEGSPAASAVAPRKGPAPPTSFSACRPALSQETLEVVKVMGFENMTPVQVCR